MGAGSDPLGLTSDLAASMGLGGQVLGGVLREPRVSHAQLDSDGAGSSGVRFLDDVGAKLEGSTRGQRLEGGDRSDDEPELLLNFLNAQQRRVAKSLYQMLPGLPCRIELELLDFFTFQLDREFIFHNVIVSDHEERVNKVFLQYHKMLEAIDGLRQEKVALEVRLLSKLAKLKKTLDEIFVLQEKAA